MRPWALGRKNWLFAGSLESGQRAASIMSLIQSARLNGIDPYAYLADVLRRLPTHKDKDIDELLPHVWNMQWGLVGCLLNNNTYSCFRCHIPPIKKP